MQYLCHREEEVARIERALTSFYGAVMNEWGSEEAARAADDWIEELEKTGADEYPDWHSVTARAAQRVAQRVVATHPYYCRIVEMSGL